MGRGLATDGNETDMLKGVFLCFSESMDGLHGLRRGGTAFESQSVYITPSTKIHSHNILELLVEFFQASEQSSQNPSAGKIFTEPGIR